MAHHQHRTQVNNRYGRGRTNRISGATWPLPMTANQTGSVVVGTNSVKQQMLECWGPMIHEYYSGTEDLGATYILAEEWLAIPVR